MDKESNLNMTAISSKKFIELLHESIGMNIKEPLAGFSDTPQIIKDSIFRFAQKWELGFCELDLAALTLEELLGTPYVNEHAKVQRNINALFPDERRDGKIGVFVINNIAPAPQELRLAILPLLDRRGTLGSSGYNLPDRWQVVLLGHGPNNKDFPGLEGDLLSRCRCLIVT